MIPNPQEDDDDRAGGMDYQPDFDRDLDDIPTEEVPSVAAAVEPSPVPGPVKDALATTGEPGAPEAAIVPSGPVQPSEGLIEAEDEGSDADEEDESGPATQVMRSILAGLSSATPADMDSEDELEASTQPASPEVAGAQDEHMASDDEEDEEEDASGTATLAMQAVLSNTAGPVDPSQGETGEETDELEDEDDAPGAATLAMQVVLSNTSQPIRDAPDDSEDESVTTVMIDRQYPKPSAALPNSAQAAPPSPEGTIDVASRSQTRSPLPQHPTPPPPPPPAEPEPKIEPVVETEPTPARNSSVQKRRRSSARPILRKSLGLPGIGSNIPHYDLGTPSRKKTRICAYSLASLFDLHLLTAFAALALVSRGSRRQRRHDQLFRPVRRPWFLDVGRPSRDPIVGGRDGEEVLDRTSVVPALPPARLSRLGSGGVCDVRCAPPGRQEDMDGGGRSGAQEAGRTGYGAVGGDGR